MRLKILIIFSLLLFTIKIFALQNDQFLSTKFYEINARVGPGKIYPIKSIYKKKFLPLKILGDYEDWKQVEDIDGDSGWMHISTLSKSRSVIFTKEKKIFRRPTEKSVLIAKAEKHVICRVKQCKDNWCSVQCENQRGWVKCNNLWGLYKNECSIK
jgi:SH3-like domain-containing protein